MSSKWKRWRYGRGATLRLTDDISITVSVPLDGSSDNWKATVLSKTTPPIYETEDEAREGAEDIAFHMLTDALSALPTPQEQEEA